MEEQFHEFGLVAEELENDESDKDYKDNEIKTIIASMELPEQYPYGGDCHINLEGNYFLGVTYFGPRYLH